TARSRFRSVIRPLPYRSSSAAAPLSHSIATLSLMEAKISSLSSIIFSFNFSYPIAITPFTESLQHSNSQNYSIIFHDKRQEISDDFASRKLLRNLHGSDSQIFRLLGNFSIVTAGFSGRRRFDLAILVSQP